MVDDGHSTYCSHPIGKIKARVYVGNKVYHICECGDNVLISDHGHIQKLGQNRMKSDQELVDEEFLRELDMIAKGG